MFYERLNDLCKKRGTKLTPLLIELGLGTGATGRWKKGNLPNGDTLISLANALETSVDYLLGRTDKLNMENEKSLLTPDESELLKDYKELSKQGKEFIRQSMVLALNTYKKDIVVSNMEAVAKSV